MAGRGEAAAGSSEAAAGSGEAPAAAGWAQATAAWARATATTVLTFIIGCVQWAQATATTYLATLFGFVTILRVRWFGATMIVATLVFFNASAYMSPFEVTYRCFLSLLLLLPGCALFPFPRNLNLKQRLELERNKWCNSIPYDVLRGFGSLSCYYLFDRLGSLVQIQTDQNLMRATIPFYLFLVVIDLLYDIEDAFAVCDGYTFAGYGLMVKQTIVKQWLILPTCFFFCVLKNYLRSNREVILAEIEKHGDNLLPTHQTAAILGSEATTVPPSASVPSTSVAMRVMERQLSNNTRIGAESDELYY